MEEWLIYQADARERRVLHQGVRALLCASLGHAEAAEKAFTEFTRALFPERGEVEAKHDETAQKILEKVGDAPIPVRAAVSLESRWGARVRRSRVGKKPEA